MKTLFILSFFPNFRREICATEIYQQRLWSGWIFFEETNSRGVTVDNIEICRG
jgi:hypothetical protein